jgi:hypothetical protein
MECPRTICIRRPTLLLVLGALSMLSMAVSAEPSQEYKVQESIRCSYGNGCPRMLRNAMSRATQFCQSEGGVRRGNRRSDFRCEQRGIYCTVSGRIECVGRLDPSGGASSSTAPRTSSGFDLLPSGQPPDRTCLDLQCSRYIDHGSGTVEQGVPACDPGFAMVGLSGRGSDFMCARLDTPVLETVLDTETQRAGKHACPPGMFARGIDDRRTTLLCSRCGATPGSEIVVSAPDDQGIQVCNEDPERTLYVTGVDGAREGLLCAPAE